MYSSDNNNIIKSFYFVNETGGKAAGRCLAQLTISWFSSRTLTSSLSSEMDSFAKIKA
jgi:hypothetical protein